MANIKQEQLEPIEIEDIKGLSLKLDLNNRDPSTWQVIDCFDLTVHGSARKCLPPVIYGISPGVLITNFIDYKKTSGAVGQVIGIGVNGKIYDLTTGLQVGDASPYISSTVGKAPFLAVLPGTLIPYNFRIWKASTVYAINDAVIKFAEDGTLYIFVVTARTSDFKTGATESIWPRTGTLVDNHVTWTNVGAQDSNLFENNYLIIIAVGNQPVKWDGASVTQLGVSAPLIPLEVRVVQESPNLNGYNPQVGAFYAYTFFNPRTLHESSPSPLVAQTNLFATDQAATISVPGALLPPILVKPTGADRSYQQVSLGVPAAFLTPAIGQGFTHLRFYRSKDGGATLLLLTTLYDASGNNICNSDGSVTIADLVASSPSSDYEPLPTPQAAQSFIGVYEGFGVPNLVPDFQTLDPNTWTDFSTGAIAVLAGGAPSGDNAFQYIGTGVASGLIFQKSGPILGTKNATYAFKGYVNATDVTAGTVGWRIVNKAGTVLATFAQTNGTQGNVTGTVALNTAEVFVEAFINGTATLSLDVLWADPILQLGSVTTPIGFPERDSSLVTPSPPIDSADPPPVAEWGAVFQGSLFVQNSIDKTKIHPSDAIDFESFGVSKFLRFPTDADDPITTMLGVFDKLIISKKRSTQQIAGNSFEDFRPAPIDPQHGILGKRAIIAVGSAIVGLLTEGISLVGLGLSLPSPGEIQVGFRPQLVVGDDVQPITALIPPDAYDDIVNFAYDTTQGQLLFAFPLV